MIGREEIVGRLQFCPCGLHLIVADAEGRYLSPPRDRACFMAERRRRIVGRSALESNLRLAGADFRLVAPVEVARRRTNGRRSSRPKEVTGPRRGR